LHPFLPLYAPCTLRRALLFKIKKTRRRSDRSVIYAITIYSTVTVDTSRKRLHIVAPYTSCNEYGIKKRLCQASGDSVDSSRRKSFLAKNAVFSGDVWYNNGYGKRFFKTTFSKPPNGTVPICVLKQCYTHSTDDRRKK